MPDIQRVVGIAIDAPKYAGPSNPEDMLLMEFRMRASSGSNGGALSTPQLQMTKQTVSEFPSTSKAKTTSHKRVKVGRNDPCVCGSGRKSKKCCAR
ncbi:MAG: SEC-C domain-containing protein [Sphingomonadales bacterium]|nr:SEC-C domain-containing protein [Sphingomonadales bacterium]